MHAAVSSCSYWPSLLSLFAYYLPFFLTYSRFWVTWHTFQFSHTRSVLRDVMLVAVETLQFMLIVYALESSSLLLSKCSVQLTSPCSQSILQQFYNSTWRIMCHDRIEGFIIYIIYYMPIAFTNTPKRKGLIYFCKKIGQNRPVQISSTVLPY